MTRDEMLAIAMQCGIDAEQDTLCRNEGWVEAMLKFADMVATNERVEILGLIDGMSASYRDIDEVFDAIANRAEKKC